jgi:glycosyltransferase involved in cell wall biosynthesis
MCLTLMSVGFEPLLVGRLQKGSLPLGRPYPIKRFKHLPSKGALFYAALNVRLFLFLLRQKAEVIHANDLDTLPAAFAASLIKGVHLVYDTHEYFLGVPELQNRPWVRRVWAFWERLIFPRLKYVFTVNQGIAQLYERDYGLKPQVIRNVPMHIRERANTVQRLDLGIPEDVPLLVIQGSGLNVDRGLEEAVQSLHHLPHAWLMLIGNGDALPALKQLAADEGLLPRILFLPKMAYPEMMARTALADVGLSVDKDTNINYRFSLPNKIFDYMAAGVPVLASPLPEVQQVIEHYCAGVIAREVSPEAIAEAANVLIARGKSHFEPALRAASADLVWEREAIPMEACYRRLGQEYAAARSNK